ncbi:cytochrome c oxidase subunit II [Falsiroseomonas sp. HW251]|uniref:cytochrome c oxidase subunit II n=1 Tax=Falsiroseomonas sp. HW251 TaxID=3390998 RepID=UPI003D31B87B
MKDALGALCVLLAKAARHGGLVLLGLLALGGAAMAQGASPGMIGAPQPWGVGLQPAGGPIKESIHSFNDLVFWIIVLITVFVAGLLCYVVWKFRESANPAPSKTSHNTTLEIAWTVVPVLILVIIAIPSFRLIYYQDRAVDPEMTINVQGRQWYWHYAYPDSGNFTFDSYPVADSDIQPAQGQIRSLSVDNPLVIPVGASIRILTTGQDVIHSFFVPSLGVQRYTIPGRTLETWVRADRPGIYYGQCNQICGTNHWFMPIEVRAVPREEFNAWAEQARTRFAQGLPPGLPPSALAAAPAGAREPAVAEAVSTLLAEARR